MNGEFPEEELWRIWEQSHRELKKCKYCNKCNKCLYFDIIYKKIKYPHILRDEKSN